MLKLRKLREGDRVSFQYPVHGSRNVLRNVRGTVDHVGRGINSDYVTVNEDSGKIRSFSERKIVAR